MSGHYQQQGFHPSQNYPQHAPMHSDGLRVATNCFRIDRVPNAKFTLYDVTFTPDIPKTRWRKRTELVYHLQHTVAPTVFSPQFLYDGGAIGFAHPTLRQRLGPERSNVEKFRLRLRDSAVPPPDAKNVWIIHFKEAKAVPITATEINDVIIGGKESPRRSSLLNFMQLIVRQANDNIHASNGRAYFPSPPTRRPGDREPPPARRTADRPPEPPRLKLLDKGLELRAGIFHSVRPAIGSLVIVVDTVAATFYQAGSLRDAFLSVLGIKNARDVSPQDLIVAKKWFKGVKIRERKGSQGPEGGRKTIKGFHIQGCMYEFTNKDGHPITIRDHYRQAYNVNPLPTLPGVIVREEPHLEILPMEYCTIEEGQVFKKALPEWVAREMGGIATLLPEYKKPRIAEAAQRYQRCSAMIEAGMSVESQPMVVPATILPTPLIEFHPGSREPKVAVKDGRWNVLNKRLVSTVEWCHWAVINFAPTGLRNEVLKNHLRNFQDCARNLGIPLSDPLLVENADVSSGGPNQVLRKLDGVLGKIKNMGHIQNVSEEMLNTKRFFILCILDKEAAGVRTTLKNWGDVKEGVITQCVRLNKLPFKGDGSQYWNNVLLKVNVRMGGENSRISRSPAYDKMTRAGPTMVVGADVGHASPGVRKPSIASLVYSYDRVGGIQYNALTALQDPRTEVIADLGPMMFYAMKDFHARVKLAIHQIIFYRDGVSEGEYERIEKVEIAAVQVAIDRIWATPGPWQAAPKPKLVFIVVGKRHRTLLFPESRNLSDRTGNCPAGLVVDEGITQPNITDFYLLSHSAIIGTSRSSHYIVLRNDVAPGDTRLLEAFSYALCHLYAKATRSVSIPAPVYYADLVCSRDSFHFEPGKEDDLRASDAGSTVDGTIAPFDLGPWLEAFKHRHPRLNGNMYFL